MPLLTLNNITMNFGYYFIEYRSVYWRLLGRFQVDEVKSRSVIRCLLSKQPPSKSTFKSPKPRRTLVPYLGPFNMGLSAIFPYSKIADNKMSYS